METIKRFINDDEGASAIEYGLIAGLIAVGLVVAIGDVKTAISGLLDTTSGAINTAAGNIK